MDTREKWERMTNPTCAEDWCIRVPLDELFREAPDIYEREIVPLNLPNGNGSVK